MLLFLELGVLINPQQIIRKLKFNHTQNFHNLKKVDMLDMLNKPIKNIVSHITNEIIWKICFIRHNENEHLYSINTESKK